MKTFAILFIMAVILYRFLFRPQKVVSSPAVVEDYGQVDPTSMFKDLHRRLDGETDLQAEHRRQTAWNDLYAGKKIRWKATIASITPLGTNEISVDAIHLFKWAGSMQAFGLRCIFPASQKGELLKYSKEARVVVSGRLTEIPFFENQSLKLVDVEIFDDV